MILVRNLVALVALVFAGSVAIATAGESHAEYERQPALVICEVFGDRYCGQALRVAWCESRLDTRAANGQYRGLFQMGERERRRYGHGSTPRAQAQAARRYFLATGRTWRPWECRP
jgi:hypothetical protein